MHEAAVTEALVQQVRELLPAGAVLCRCRIAVGELEHLDADVMRMMWRSFTAGTALADADLEVVRVALAVRCRECGTDFVPEDPAILLCPACGLARPEVREGTGIVVQSLEVEEPS